VPHCAGLAGARAVRDGRAAQSDGILSDVLGCTIVALRALLTTHWEEAASFADHSLRLLTLHAEQCKAGLQSLGLQIAHLEWALHTILGR